MKTRRITLALALLLCISVCMTGCGVFLTTPSFDFSPDTFNDPSEEQLPVYNPGALVNPNHKDNDLGAQGNTATVSKTRPYYDLGSNKTLKDKIVVLFVFVDDNTSEWTYGEIMSFVEYQVEPALYYLIDEAQNWGVTLEFEYYVFSSVTSELDIKYEGEVGNGLEENDMSKDVLKHTASDLGFESTETMLSTHRTRYSNTEIAYVNVFNTVGRSYTCMQVGTPSLEYTEHCVLFADAYEGDPRLAETRSATVAHEFLHLYGAEDFYTPDERAALAAQTYPTDIMLIASTSLDQISFSDMTAYMIGWYNVPPQICYKNGWRAK